MEGIGVMRHLRWRLIVVLSIIFILICSIAYAATTNGTCGENVTWTLYDSGQLNISGSGPMYSDCTYIWSTNTTYQNKIKNVIISSGVTIIRAAGKFSP